jgi:hypothetical protein
MIMTTTQFDALPNGTRVKLTTDPVAGRVVRSPEWTASEIHWDDGTGMVMRTDSLGASDWLQDLEAIDTPMTVSSM